MTAANVLERKRLTQLARPRCACGNYATRRKGHRWRCGSCAGATFLAVKGAKR